MFGVVEVWLDFAVTGKRRVFVLEVLVSSETGDSALVVAAATGGDRTCRPYGNYFAVILDQDFADVVRARTEELLRPTVVIEFDGIGTRTGAGCPVYCP